MISSACRRTPRRTPATSAQPFAPGTDDLAGWGRVRVAQPSLTINPKTMSGSTSTRRGTPAVFCWRGNRLGQCNYRTMTTHTAGIGLLGVVMLGMVRARVANRRAQATARQLQAPGVKRQQTPPALPIR